MGRGRQKAKQTKVARQLKYYSPDTDYNALQRELGGSEGGPVVESSADGSADDVDDDLDDEADEYDDWASDRSR
jgi:Protein of unknown function (DUF3073)